MILKSDFNIRVILDDLLNKRIDKSEATQRLWALHVLDREEVINALDKIIYTLQNGSVISLE